MPVERTGIGNTCVDETDGVVVAKELPARTAVSLLNTASLSETVVTSDSLDSLTSMDLGGQLVSNNVQLSLNTTQAELENTENSAGGGGISKDAPNLSADNVAAGALAAPTASKTVNDVVMSSPVKQISVQSGSARTTENNLISAGTKRPLPSNSNTSPMVTKVIITKNPGSSQPQVVPIQFNQLQGQTLSFASLPQGINTIPQLPNQGSLTPTKTITISSQGIMTSGGKQILTTLGPPTKIVNKIPIPQATKTPPKITMIPVSLGKSPQRAAIAPGSSVVVSRAINSAVSSSSIASTVVASSGQLKPATITMSPTKVILKSANQINKSLPISISAATGLSSPISQMSLASASQAGVQQISVPGSKFHYVRLVTPTTQANTVLKTSGGQVLQVKPIAPATVSLTPSTSGQVRLTSAGLALQPSSVKAVINPGSGQQRILLPAPNQVAIRPVVSAPTSAPAQIQVSTATTSSANFSNLPPGTTIISSSGNIPGVQGFALVPAHYVNQLRQQQAAKPVQQQQHQQHQQQQQQQQHQIRQQPPQPVESLSPPQNSRNDFIPIASIDPAISASTLARNVSNGRTEIQSTGLTLTLCETNAIEPTGARPRKPCNCTKSQCLKLYCDCFANGEFCHDCNCTNCANNLEHEEGRSRAIKACLDRNPMAFHPKIGKGRVGDGDRRHNKGCNCKRSGCLKNYCECYEAKIMCSSTCKCIGCKNFEESPERKTLMHLADAAEVRVLQQTAAKSKLSSQISDLPLRPPATTTGERLPYTFVTTEVAEATCACLLAQLEEADRLKMPEVVQERMVIEEFGRCLMQIIDSANKTRDTPIMSEVFNKGKTKTVPRSLKKGGGDG